MQVILHVTAEVWPPAMRQDSAMLGVSAASSTVLGCQQRKQEPHREASGGRSNRNMPQCAGSCAHRRLLHCWPARLFLLSTLTVGREDFCPPLIWQVPPRSLLLNHWMLWSVQLHLLATPAMPKALYYYKNKYTGSEVQPAVQRTSQNSVFTLNDILEYSKYLFVAVHHNFFFLNHHLTCF